MGKAEEDQPLPPGVAYEDPEQNVEARCGCSSSSIRKFIGFRCIFILLLSAAVFLSAVFWLPPFIRHADQKDLYADSEYKGHNIVASFIVRKPVSLLQGNISQLADDIFEELGGVLSTKVVILSLDPFSGSNMTKVVFAVEPEDKYSEMSSTAISLIRSSFESLVIGQSYLHLTSYLFGDPFLFEVLKFKGGITIIPQQSGFLLQTAQTLFSFTLNFSVSQIQLNFEDLTSQLKSGLHLAPYENLYLILSNTEGSTVAAPTIVQSSVFLAIGITPSKERLKQLAQTITGSHFKNLGLNNTKFGRVKQVRLSSILQHSLHGGDGSGTTWSPSPAPLAHAHHGHGHGHGHHHHHHHHHNAHLAPISSPTSAPGGAIPPEVGSPAAAESVPAPGRNSQAETPNCRFGYRKRPTRNTGKHTLQTPAVAPTIAPPYPAASPKQQDASPPHVSGSVPALSPLPNVAFAGAEPPPNNEPAAERSSDTHFHRPSPSSSSAGCLGTSGNNKTKSTINVGYAKGELHISFSHYVVEALYNG
ncbi:inactive histone-lysine N-methyltransferase 2E-like isoform X2 [Senna tora]|uniref:Inactive histone-lysine N-methyltransferase 2E-like isoform X2 n=1 Tax=Senna tora TaxID=362788 RepID=A0A834SUZ8_9FABA|nr:inactive histone-lysine N-methyltransferase 2E-like isoform X2 [Senna tora]